ncbi:hypothetical protein V5O48_005702 [Marasmius crinis-equi]|uniref:Transglycosylase SLT domain-containing protein n=1 Tax=Marasmius crinis-equi TaxID=585013 RepID=A0ABR3FM42_9AGAR
MKAHFLALAALCCTLAVEATNAHQLRSSGHSRRFSHVESRDTKVVNGKKCRVRSRSKTASKATTNANVNNNASAKNNVNTNTASISVNLNVGGLLSVSSSCGHVGATSSITSDAGPNGAMGWINCGIDGSGWRPQNVQVGDLKVVDLSAALQDSNSPFTACAPYIDKFVQYGNQYGVPPILMASFAMQESTCNPSTVGGAGEVGLMQITPDKCGGAPGGNCFDPDFNIQTATAYFKGVLDGCGGNVFQAIGQYNGWQPGMTIASATAAAGTSCCRCQNNLDYLFQMVNGWMQNVSPYARHLGKYFNLDQCH